MSHTVLAHHTTQNMALRSSFLLTPYSVCLQHFEVSHTFRAHWAVSLISYFTEF